MIVLQHIVTRWEKDARGGAAAVRRNSVKEAYPIRLAREQRAGARFVIQTIHFGADGEYGKSRETLFIEEEVPQPIGAGCADVTWTDEELSAAFTWNRFCGGAPERGWARKTLVIRVGEWGQIVYNGRFSEGYDSYWRYEKHVVNVGWFEEWDSRAFVRGEPTHRFEAMADLW
jgi:hypothetical protein